MTALDDELLDRLEDRWRRVGAPVAGHLRGGLPADELERLLARLPGRVPDEVRLWWAWQDGTAPAQGPGVMVTPELSLLSVTDALLRRTMLLNVAQQAGEATGLPASTFFPDDWLPIMRGENTHVVAQVSDEPPALAALRFQEPASQDNHRIRVTSIGQMVQTWIDMIDSGLWTYTDGFWHHDPQEIPDAIWSTRLV